MIEARSGKGPWETFFIHPVRGPIFRGQLNGEWEIDGGYTRWIRSYDRLQQDERNDDDEQRAAEHRVRQHPLDPSSRSDAERAPGFDFAIYRSGLGFNFVRRGHPVRLSRD